MDDGVSSEPYLDSGQRAALQCRKRMSKSSLKDSLHDANELESRANEVMRRGSRSMCMALAATLSCLGVGVLAGVKAATGYDGTFDGTVRANWLMLLGIVGLVGAQFAWMWFAQSRGLRATGRRLRVRSEYQRRLAALQLERKNHDPIR